MQACSHSYELVAKVGNVKSQNMHCRKYCGKQSGLGKGQTLPGFYLLSRAILDLGHIIEIQLNTLVTGLHYVRGPGQGGCQGAHTLCRLFGCDVVFLQGQVSEVPPERGQGRQLRLVM